MSVNISRTNSARREPERDAFSVNETAASYGVSPGLIRLEIARGNLRTYRIDRRIVITHKAISAWLGNK